MAIRTDQLVFAIILIALGVGQVTQFLNFSNFPPGLILICVGLSYILR
jgi:hypothetical protein